MPDKRAHLAGSRKSEEFGDFVLSTDYKQWAITGYFYSALHLIDAFLATLDQHPKEHYRRDSYLARLSDLKAIYGNYRMLETESRRARYDLSSFSDGEIGQLKSDYLDPIKQHISVLMGGV